MWLVTLLAFQVTDDSFNLFIIEYMLPGGHRGIWQAVADEDWRSVLKAYVIFLRQQAP